MSRLRILRMQAGVLRHAVRAVFQPGRYAFFVIDLKRRNIDAVGPPEAVRALAGACAAIAKPVAEASKWGDREVKGSLLVHMPEERPKEEVDVT